MTTAPLLRTEGIVKRFGGVMALDHVRFDLRPGEIHALCGENGAGKSTLIKIISGLHPAGSYQGSLLVDEQDQVIVIRHHCKRANFDREDRSQQRKTLENPFLAM